MRATAFTVGEREVSWQQVLALTPQSARRPQSEEQFRRDRELISAADLLTWLEHWHVDLDELRTWLADGVVSAWAEGVLSGELERCATRLAHDAAAVIAAGGKPPAVDDRLARRAHRSRQALHRTVPAARAKAVAEANALQWQVAVYDEVSPGHRMQAAELGLLVRHDGLSLRDAAARAGLAATGRRAEIGELARPLGPMLASTDVGEVLILEQVIQLIGKRPVRARLLRARDVLVEERVAAVAAGAVVWSDR